MADTRYLTKRRNTWFINYPVPKKLQEVIGTTYIGRTTGTHNLVEARAVRNAFLVEIDKIAAAHNQQTSPASLLSVKLLLLEKVLSGLSDADKQQELEMLESKLVDKLQDRYGHDLGPSKIPDTDEDKLELIAVQKLAGRAHIPEPDITLREALAETLADLERADTRYRFEHSVDLLLAFLKRDNIKLQNISRRIVRDFLKSQEVQGKGKSTIDGYLTSLSEIWRNQADIENVSGDNPFKGHKTKGEKKSYVPFSRDELTALMCAINGKEDTLITLIGYYTGMRRGEIWGLRQCDILTEEGITYIRVVETGDRSLKTENAVRRIPVHSALLTPLLKHIEGLDNENKLFTHRTDDDAFGKYFGRIKSNIVKNRQKTFHSLRAGMATYLEQGGVPEATAVWILGHTRNLSLSYGLYSQGPSLEQLQKAVESIPSILEPTHLK